MKWLKNDVHASFCSYKREAFSINKVFDLMRDQVTSILRYGSEYFKFAMAIPALNNT